MTKPSLATFLLVVTASSFGMSPAGAADIYLCDWQNGKAKGTEVYDINFKAKTVNGYKAIVLSESFAEFETTDAHFWIDLDVGSYSALNKNRTLVEGTAGACRRKPSFKVLHEQRYRSAGEERPVTDRSRF